MRALRSFLADRRAAAAAEMALVLPMLLALMFCVLEGGYFFYLEHQVVKGVRDGARFAARQDFTRDYPSASCTSGTVAADTTIYSAGLETAIKNVTIYGQLAAGTPRVSTWTTSNTTVAVTCPNVTNVSTNGIYKNVTFSPVVTVSAKVPYPSLFSKLTGISTSFSLFAKGQAAVVGI